ncbi:MAG: anhydro-N-acetylmuramic acid kinase [Chlorobi bacterium]|nr:anhydro-N-acetylmuramic acid kinase [Chlorobiota bacterium]
MKKYTGVGIMSGTSVDGLDIALCNFYFENSEWQFEIIKAETFKYDLHWRKKLKEAYKLTSFELLKLHKEYGAFTGKQINIFLKSVKLKIDFIASHGHTVFHQPEKKVSFQLGDGACIAAETKHLTISDFRNQDVVLGGNGAPLVPIGDMFLFSEYDYCINLGGFANISFQKNDNRIAFDICPVNIIINYLSEMKGFEFDDKGKIAAKGSINNSLLLQLNNINYYKKEPPKSLGIEWLKKEFLPLVNSANLSIEDKMRTIYEHISLMITKNVMNSKSKKVLITGGGAYNDFLIQCIKEKTDSIIVLPEKKIIEFKEALIFAFLGLLRLQNKINCLSSVTGAKYNHSGGVIHTINIVN